MTGRASLRGVVCEGYGVASGIRCAVFPGGTIAAQLPHFKERGLDLYHCFSGTLNVSVAPHVLTMVDPQFTFEAVEWSPGHPRETFSFSPCRLLFRARPAAGYIYYPHPETKPAHPHPPSLVEVLAPFIEGIAYGVGVALEVDQREVRID